MIGAVELIALAGLGLLLTGGWKLPQVGDALGRTVGELDHADERAREGDR